VLQCVAVCCSALRRRFTIICCSYVLRSVGFAAVCCRGVQCVAVCCSRDLSLFVAVAC